MQDLIGSRVVVRDTVGYMLEGDFDGVERDEDGLAYVLLSAARQINYVNMQEEPPQVDGWELPGRRRVAKHLVVEIGMTHLDGSAGKSEVTKGSPRAKAKRKAASS